MRKDATSRTTFDLFDEPDEATKSLHACMNGWIRGQRDAKEHTLRPTSARVNGNSELNQLRDAHAAALTEYELAVKSGDEDRIAFADHVLEREINASRAARGGGSLPDRDLETGQFVESPSFDGGVRSRRIAGGPGARGPQLSSNQLLKLMIDASREEARERQQERTIHTQ